MKMETTNPGGSSKDRPALEMILAAERDGSLQPGGTIVEPTSGNTGTGLAIAAALKGYRLICVMTDKVAEEKRSLLRAYGAEVVICPSIVSFDSPEHYQNVAARLATEIPGACMPNQYANPANPLSHYRTTGPEIWDDTEGKVTVFVAGIGTTGTIVGTARYLKEKNPAITVVGADPAGFLLKETLKGHLQNLGIVVHDLGTASGESTDYPDFARAVAENVTARKSRFGLLVCSSGIGMSIAALRAASK
jgi:cystathionine beta-synthase